MIEINLLPVRAARKKESVRFQLTMFSLILVFVLIIIAYFSWSASKREARIDTQLKLVQEDLVRLNKEVGEIDELKQRKAKLEQKLAVIKDLDKGRLRAAYILGELSQRTPEKVWIESLDKSGKDLKITGVALDNETIANFMDVLGRSKYFTGVELEITEQIDRGGLKLMRFSLRCSTVI
jgi:type IV pilus assembly protein PilN